MTNRNIDIMDIIVSKLAHGKTISQALKTVYTKRNVAIPYDEKLLNVSIAEFELSARAKNALLRGHLDTVGKIVNFATTEGIRKVKTFGEKCGIELFEIILDYAWGHMTKDEQTNFLIDTVERNSKNIRAELI